MNKTSFLKRKLTSKSQFALLLFLAFIFSLSFINTAAAKDILIGTSADNVGIGTATPGYKLYVSGSAFANSLIVNTTGGTWLTGKTGTAGLIASTPQTASAYHPFIRQTTASGHVISIGGLGDNFGFYGYDVNRTENSFDYSLIMNLANGNVGVGTTAPGQKLEVNGNLKLSAANPYIYSGSSWIGIPNGLNISGGTLYVANQAQMRGGIHNDSATYLTIAGGTAGDTYFSGDVGIGSTAPAQKLDVAGGGQFTSPVIVAAPTATNHAATKSYVDSAVSSINATLFDGIDSPRFIYGQNGSGSNSVISTSTLNAYELSQYKSGFWDVVSASWTPDASWYWGGTFAHTSNSTSYNYAGQLIFKNGGGGNSIYARTISGGSPSAWSRLLSDTSNVNSSGNLLITGSGPHYISSGNVGIGTTAPAVKLDVAGSAFFGSTNKLKIQEISDTLSIQATTAASDSVKKDIILNAWGGNIGIGTSTPIDKLHVVGNVTVSGIAGCTGTGSAIKTDASGRLTCGTIAGGITGSGTANYVARWTAASTLGVGALYDNGTNVGVGDTAPSAKLQVVTGNLNGGSIGSTWGNTWLVVGGSGGTGSATGIGYDTTNNVGIIQPATPGTAYRGLSLVPRGGGVSIATTSISYVLDVNGSGRFTQPVIVGSPSAASHAATKSYVDSASGGGVGSGTSGQTLRNNGTSWVANSNLFNNGTNVGVGTATPGAKLDVNGSASINGTLIMKGNNYISLQEGQFINRRFEMIENSTPQYILLCANAANNDVSGTISMNRTSGLYQSAIVDVIVTSGSSAMYGGTLRTLQYLNGDIRYNLVTVTYGGTSYVAIKVSGQPYLETSGAYFTGRLVDTSGNALVVADAASITNEAAFGSDSLAAFETNKFTVSGNVGIGTTNPTDKLHVVGNATISGIAGCTGTGSAIKTDASGRLTCGTIAGGITGSGTANYVARWTNTGILGTGILYDNGTNVGIGVTNPIEKLNVANGNILINASTSSTGALVGANSSDSFSVRGVTIPHYGLKWATPTDTAGNNLFASGYFGISLFTGGNERLKIDTSGNIGVGTASPSYKLDVAGNAQFTQPVIVGTPTAANHAVTKGYVDSAIGDPVGAGTAGQTLRNDGTSWVANSTLFNNGTNIGIATTTPAGALDIATTASSNGYFLDGKSAMTGESSDNWLRLNNSNSWANGIYTPGVVRVDGELRQGSSDYGAYGLQTSGSLYVNTGAVLAASSGNVGIGTTNPADKLSVRGGISKETSAGIDGTFDNIIKYGYYGDLESGGAAANRWHGIDATITAGAAAANKMKFRLYHGSTDNVAPIDVMTLQGDGNVGIGTNTPADKLYVAGNATISGIAGCTGTGSAIKTDASGRLVCGAIAGGVTGSGTVNYVARWTTASTLSTGTLYDNGTNVGIGTSNPTSKLQVNGKTQITDAVAGADTQSYSTFGVTREASTSALTYIAMTRSGNVVKGMGIDGSNNWIFGAPTSGTQIIASPWMSITHGGNVGIGSTVPAQKLDVAGSGQFTQPVIIGTPTASNHAVTKSYVDSAVGGGVGAGTSGQTLRHNGTNWVANSNLFNNGTNVGIGTTAPSQKLDVNGTINVASGIILNGVLDAGSASGNGYRFNGRSMSWNSAMQSPGSYVPHVFQQTYTGWDPVLGVKTSNGLWQMGAYSNDTLYLGYMAGAFGGHSVNSFDKSISISTTTVQVGDSGTMNLIVNGSIGVGTSPSAGYAIDADGKIRASSFEGNLSGTATSLAANGANCAAGSYPLGVDASGNVEGCTVAATGGLSGSGAANYVARWTGTTALSIGALYDNGTNVSIGTTAPGAKLDVQGKIRISNNGDNVYSSYSGGLNYELIGTYSGWNASTVYLAGYNASNGGSATAIAFGGSGKERLYTNLTTGNVGIGTTTPSTKLYVSGGDIYSSNSIMAGGDIYSNGSYYYGKDNNVVMEYDDGWLRLNPNGDFYSGIYAAGSIVRTDGELQVGSGGATFRAISGGNVGIGTTAPRTKLEVNGTINTTNAGGNTTGELNVGPNGLYSWNGSTRYIRFNTAGSVNDLKSYGADLVINYDSGKNVQIGPGYNKPSKLSVVGNLAVGDATFVNTAAPTSGLSVQGNTGIGTASPTSKLEVVGDAKATSFTYSSDRNLKTNIKTVNNALSKIQKLRGVTFNWKKDGSKSVGLIAQEVEQVFPELVSGTEGNKGVEYGNLVGPLIEAVKEQQKEIDKLQYRISVLEKTSVKKTK